MQDTTPKTNPQSAKTLMELCGQPEDSFEKYLAQKEAYLSQLDQKAEKRIEAALSQNMSWAV